MSFTVYLFEYVAGHGAIVTLANEVIELAARYTTPDEGRAVQGKVIFIFEVGQQAGSSGT